MEFTKIQKDIIRYIIEYYEKSEKKLTPCIEVLQHIYSEDYSNLEIEVNVRKLISRRILGTYSFHAYLGLTETFKTSLDYNLFKDKKI